MDRFGLMTLPATAGGLNPALLVILDFAKAVLVAELQAAWATAAPAEPNEIVKNVYAEDPAKIVFVERDLPALFLCELDGEFADLTDGYTQHATTLILRWLFPPSSKDRKRTQDLVSPALAKAFAAAVSDGRHEAWTHPSDLADVDAIKVAFAAPLVDTTYSGADFDGATGADAFAKPGRLLLSLTAGDWDTTAAIVVSTLLPNGTTQDESVYLTSATDAQQVEAAWVSGQVVSVFVPGQPSAVGSIQIGLALAPACEFGSALQDHTGTSQITCGAWERKPFTKQLVNGPQSFDAVCFEIRIEEIRDRTADAKSYPLLDASQSGVATTGQVVSVDGMSVEVMAE